jgi:glutathione peroxidase
LVANDINGNQVDFSIFEDKVTVIVNVASECGYTEDHYREMVQLYDSLSSTGAFELLAFPCNQFDGQEPGDLEDIKAFTASKGVKFRVMDKINVNGRGTHDVYRYLKSVAGPDDEIEWNFAMYYVVDFEGKVHAYNNRTPLELRETIEELLEGLSEYA